MIIIQNDLLQEIRLHENNYIERINQQALLNNNNNANKLQLWRKHPFHISKALQIKTVIRSRRVGNPISRLFIPITEYVLEEIDKETES